MQDNPQSDDGGDLQSDNGGESARFASILVRRFSERISQAIVTPDILAEKLHTKHFISHSVYQAAISPDKRDNNRSGELLDRVCEGILLKSINFKDFLKALQALPQVGALPDVITSLQAEHDKPQSSTSVQPQSPDTGKPVRVEVELAARRDFLLMRGKFLRLTGTIRSALKKKITDQELELAALKSQLILAEPEHEELFSKAESLDDLVTVIFKDCPFTNPDLLESLAVQFDLPDIEEAVDKYRDGLEQYYDQVLAQDFVNEGLNEYDKDANITVHFVVRWAKGSYLSQFESLLHLIFWKAKKYLTLRAVHQSNLTFVCTAPRWMMNVLKRMIKMEEEVLGRVGVIQLEIEGEPVFQEKMADSVVSTDKMAILGEELSQALQGTVIPHKDKIAILQEQIHQQYSAMLGDTTQQFESYKKMGDALQETTGTIVFQAEACENLSWLKDEVERKENELQIYKTISRAKTEEMEMMRKNRDDLKTKLQTKESKLESCEKMLQERIVEIETMERTFYGKRVYNVTTRKSHALAVILNNDTFQGHFADRPWSEHDVSRLQQVLDQKLGFEVVTYRNLTSQGIIQLFQSKIEGRIQESHDSFFCCVMSHGGKAGIYGTDGTPVSIPTLKQSLDGSRCRELIGKPKIMIINCSQGGQIPEPVYETEAPGTQMPISPHSDFIVGYSTASDDIATLGVNGSPYIQTLCEVMNENDCSLNEMLCIVNRKLKEAGVQRVSGAGIHDFLQTGQVEHTLQKFAFFRLS